MHAQLDWPEPDFAYKPCFFRPPLERQNRKLPLSEQPQELGTQDKRYSRSHDSCNNTLHSTISAFQAITRGFTLIDLFDIGYFEANQTSQLVRKEYKRGLSICSLFFLSYFLLLIRVILLYLVIFKLFLLFLLLYEKSLLLYRKFVLFKVLYLYLYSFYLGFYL